MNSILKWEFVIEEFRNNKSFQWRTTCNEINGNAIENTKVKNWDTISASE